MGRKSKYPAEVRERAVRLVFKRAPAHESQAGSDQLGGGEDGLLPRAAAKSGSTGRA